MIKKIIEQRNIPYLCHFTNIKNLPNILENGLISRKKLEDTQQINVYNDSIRNDGHTNANCLSISFPNYRMFYKCRCSDSSANWAVILFQTSILYTKNCLFLTTNAAHNTMRDQRNLKYLNDPNSLELLFANDLLRAQLNIPNHYTTDPQAEILVFDTIEPKYIGAVILSNKVKIPDIYTQYETINFYIDSQLTIKFFSYRHDYNHWR